MLIEGAEKKDIECNLILTLQKLKQLNLFSNTYLAMRISFFNELDSYAEAHSLDSRQIIEGVGMDPRIGSYITITHLLVMEDIACLKILNNCEQIIVIFQIA